MIRELSIKNYALIDSLTIDFDRGFSVFTGETGAGKSILVGAIGLLLGERASMEHIRTGTDEAEISGSFTPAPFSKQLADELTNAEIPCDDDTLIIRRIIARNGRNRILINQIPVPLATLKNIGDHLIDFHGQHEHQSLLKPESADQLINNLHECKPVWETYVETYEHYCQIKKECEAFDTTAAALAQQRDLLEFQYNELAQLKLVADEEQELENEFTLLSSTQERCDCVASIAGSIEGNEDGIDALERRIASIRKNLEQLQKYDTSATPWLTDIESTISFFSELNRFCSSYLENNSESASPERLEYINSRLAKIQRFKKKYACDLNGLIAKQAALKQQLDSLENRESDRNQLVIQLSKAEKSCRKQAEQLSSIRKKTATLFDVAIAKQMEHLGFSGGGWRTVFTSSATLQPNGIETASFEVRTNKGEEFLPLIKTASGGEISRLMLAIKTVLASQDNIPILIFDEIDAGIGGHLAKAVAKAMYTLSASHQVICISHLHQIASVANHHYLVFKTEQADRTITQVKQLSPTEKIEEISRMLGSDSTLSKKHAEEMIAAFQSGVKG